MISRNLLRRRVQSLGLMRLAAWAYELYRLVRRPHTHGALVAIWWQQQLLLVKTSYRRGYGLPGGGLERGETAAQAAVRELQEELGLTVTNDGLQKPWTLSEQQAGGTQHVDDLFPALADCRPAHQSTTAAEP